MLVDGKENLDAAASPVRRCSAFGGQRLRYRRVSRPRPCCCRYPLALIYLSPDPRQVGHGELRSYAAVANDLGIAKRDESSRWRNNQAEYSNKKTQRREQRMQGFKSLAQRFLSTHAAPYNSFSVQRRLVSARTQQAIRAAAMTVWREAVAVAFETQNSFF
jgi:hypothetical protein